MRGEEEKESRGDGRGVSMSLMKKEQTEPVS